MEERDGFVRIPPEDMENITKVAEAWVDNLPFQAVKMFAIRYHTHLVIRMWMRDKEGFEEALREYGIADDGYMAEEIEHLEDCTNMLIHQMDLLVGFQGLTDEEMYIEHP